MRSIALPRRTCPKSTVRLCPGQTAGLRHDRQARPIEPSGFDGAHLRRVRGFEAITDDQADRFLAVGREEHYAPGMVVTERWAHARTFYIVLDGEVR